MAPVFDSHQLPPLWSPRSRPGCSCLEDTKRKTACLGNSPSLSPYPRAYIVPAWGQPTCLPSLPYPAKALTLQPKGSQAPLSVSLHLSTPHRDHLGRYLLSCCGARPALACANRQLHIHPQCVPTPIASPSEALHCIASNRILACRSRSTHRPRGSIIQTLCLPRLALPCLALPLSLPLVLFSSNPSFFFSLLELTPAFGHSSRQEPAHPTHTTNPPPSMRT